MSSSGCLVQGHTCCPARVARCFRGRTCPYRLRDACWFAHDDDPEEDPPCRDVAATSCRVVAATALDGLAGRIRRLERIVEQIGGVLVPQALKGDVDGLVGEQIRAVPVPQIWEPIVDGPHLVPQERVQDRTPEQIVDVPVPQITEDSLPFVPQERVQNSTPEQIVVVPVPQIMEDSSPFVPQARVQNRTPEQIVDVPVPQLMEAIVDVVPSPPQERVQNRTPERVQNRTPEQIVDVPVPQLMEAIVDVVPSPPQERVHNRTPEQIVDFPVPQIVQESVQNRTLEQVRVHSRIQEQIMDLPVSQIMAASTAYTGKVFTVDMRLLRGDQACPVDTLGFNIKGLDKYTMPRSGDVMVPALHMDVPVPQIFEDIVLRERLIELFGHSISWDSLEATLPPGLFQRLQHRAFEMEAEEEEEEEETEEEEGGILASS